MGSQPALRRVALPLPQVRRRNRRRLRSSDRTFGGHQVTSSYPQRFVMDSRAAFMHAAMRESASRSPVAI